ncbi:MAG: LysM peptidoglycan-binding domain-containing protein [Verrucomicrobia bacterium]|nr:LysM peptidoglycan-binding domain-containing protein [Verrucomicrobiota bacterium]
MRLFRRMGWGLAGCCAAWLQAAPASYTVKSGETLYQIARDSGTSVEVLTKANPGINPQRLHAGDVLHLPSSSPSTPTSTSVSAKTAPAPSVASKPTAPAEWIRIKSGDSLTKISRATGVPVDDLRRWNRLHGDTLRPGNLLRVRAPTSTLAQTNPATKKTKTPTTPPSPDKPAAPTLTFVGPARAQIDAPKDRLRDWEYIVVHHSGTSGGNAKIFDYFHRHVRGMENGMAYHFVIGNGSDSGDGQIEVGSRWLEQKQGGHLASEALNEISIGICLVGDFSTHRLGPRQTASLIELVHYLRKLQPTAKLKFRLHQLFPSPAIHEILD